MTEPPFRSRLRVPLLLCKKELLEVRRDLRTVALLVVLPALLYPLLMLGVSKAGAAGAAKLSQRTLVVAVEEPLPGDVRAALAGLENVEIVSRSSPRSAGAAATIRVSAPVLELERAPVEIVVDGGSELGLAAKGRLEGPLKKARGEARDERLLALGLSRDDLESPAVDVIDVAPPARKGGFLLGRVMVPILLVVLLLGAYYPAIDMTVGERERQTLRTLLCAPVTPMSIALGKLMAVSLLALLAASANLGGLLLTARIGVLGVEGFEVPPAAVAVAVLLCVPMAVYTSAILMAAASLTKSVREAQTLLTPLLLVMVLPAMLAALPGTEVTFALSLVPLLGPALVVREAFAGDAELLHVVGALVGGVAAAAVMLAVAARAFTVEALITGRVATPLRAPGPITVFDGALLALALGAAYLYVGVPLQIRDVVSGLVVTQLVVFAGLPLAWAAFRSTTPLAALGLDLGPRPGGLAMTMGALLLLPSLGALVSVPAERLVDPQELEAYEALFRELMALPPWALLVVIAVLPGVCEEIAFRGALLRSFAQRSAMVGVVASAALFALFHGSAARFVPTFVLGLLVGTVAIRAGSTWPAMVLHAAHNGFALVAASLLAEESLEASLADLPWPVHLLAIPGAILLIVGARRSGARGRAPKVDPGPGDSQA